MQSKYWLGRGEHRVGHAGVQGGSGIAIVGIVLALAALGASSAGVPLVRASVSTAGVQANGETTALALSRNGRYLAFVSAATNLVAGDVNGVADVFVRDLTGATTQLVSRSAEETQANGAAKEVSISDAGRFVAFTSVASNLVPGGGNGKAQLFLRDNQTGAIVRLSQSAAGVAANADVEGPNLSAQGGFAVFTSRANNLVEGNTGGKSQVYLVNTSTGELERISDSPNGVPGNNNSREAFVSADGKTVAYYSNASNLTIDDGDGLGDIFLCDRENSSTRQLTYSVFGGGINSASHCTDMTPDGKTVLFTFPGVVAGYDHDQVGCWSNDARSVLSIGSDYQLNGPSGSGKISADGRYVVYVSEATNTVDGEANGDQNRVADVFRVELDTQFIPRLVSRTQANLPSNGASTSPMLSEDGKLVAFLSAGSNLVSGDSNARVDAFVRDHSGETLLPTSLQAVDSEAPTQLVAKWVDNNTGESAYEVELAEGNGTFSRRATTAPNATRQVINGLKPNTLYRCRVRAINGTDFASFRPPAAAYTLPNPPRNLRASLSAPRSTKVNLTWEPGAGGATRFELYRITPNGPSHTRTIPSSVNFAMEVPSSPGISTTYQVLAVGNGLNRSPFSNAAHITTPPDGPNISEVDVTKGKIELTWPVSQGATAYRVKRGDSISGPYTTISGDLRTNRYTDSSEAGWRSYYYRISALNSVGEGPDGGFTFVVLPLSKPINVRASVTFEWINLSWESSDQRARSYRVFRSDRSGGPYVLRAENVFETHFYDNVGPLKKYYYVIQAFGTTGEADGVSLFSQEVSATTTPAAPVSLTAVASSGKVTLTWAAVTGATGYRLRRSPASGTPITTIGGNLTTTRYVDSGHGGGETYQYRVVAYGAGGESRESPVATATTQAVLKSLTVKPTSVKGGKKVTATVTLDVPAPAAGSTVTLTSGNPALVKLPASVRVPSGKTSLKFTFKPKKLSKKQKTTTVQITAKLEEKTVTASLRVKK